VANNGLHTLKYWSVDKAGNKEAPKTAVFTVIQPQLDTVPPVTSCDATSTYTGDATIRFTPVDAGGSGVSVTYYRLDGGSQVASGSVVIPAQAEGPVDHTLEYWSVDVAGNEELPHKTVAVRVSPAATATAQVTFFWENPSPQSSVYLYVDGVPYGYFVAPSWNGINTITLPVRAKPYSLRVDWYDQWTGDDGMCVTSLLLTTPGASVVWQY